MLPDLAELNRLWRDMSPWRRRSGMLCGLSVFAYWLWSIRTGEPLPRWVSLSAVWLGGVVLLGNVLGDERAGRRWHFAWAFLLLVTGVELRWSAWPVGIPGDLEGLGRTLAAQGEALVTLRWVGRLAQWPAVFWWLGLPFALGTLVVQRGLIGLGIWTVRLAKLGVALILLALALRLGLAFATTWSAVPTWVLLALMVLLPFGMSGNGAYAAVPLLLAVASGLLGRMLDLLHVTGPLTNGVTALALLVTAVCWLAWYVWLPRVTMMEDLYRAAAVLKKAQAEVETGAANAPPTPPPPAFDLKSHLDSDGAQEGADKYTRE